MPVSGYSTYAAYLSSVNGFQRLQTSLAQLTEQLNSGKKSSDLTTYGVETQRLVDLRAEIARRQGYIEATKSASTDVKAYDRVFTSIEDINATMLQAFTAPNTDPPTKQQHTVTFTGDLGDTGDVYKVVVDNVLFSYVTNGNEGSYDEIAGNLANQINSHTPAVRATAKVSGDRLVVTGTEPGPLFNVSVMKTEVGGGAENTIEVSLTRAGKISPIIQQVSTALIEINALLNEQVNDRYLFGGINANEAAPVVDLSRLPDPSGSKNAAASNTTQQLAPATIRQVVRITADSLGVNQSQTITVNGTPLVFNGPLTRQELAAAMAAAVGPLANVSVQDIDAAGFTITADTAGTAFTVAITGDDPTPSTAETVQANVPIGANQTDVITLSGPIGTIGEVYSITITDPPAHTSPVTISYRTTGDEPDLNTIVDKLVSKIATYQPPFAVTATNLGDGQLRLSGAAAFSSHAAVQNNPVVETTQRTVVPVAQQDEIGFPGPLDPGDQYTMTFTAPVGGPFTVTTASTDDEAAIAAKFVSAINAAGIGVTAAVRNGKLSDQVGYARHRPRLYRHALDRRGAERDGRAHDRQHRRQHPARPAAADRYRAVERTGRPQGRHLRSLGQWPHGPLHHDRQRGRHGCHRHQPDGADQRAGAAVSGFGGPRPARQRPVGADRRHDRRRAGDRTQGVSCRRRCPIRRPRSTTCIRSRRIRRSPGSALRS